ALLVFLDLLEGQTERLAELLLAHAQHDAAHAHPAANIFVNRVGCFRHLRYSLWTDIANETCLAPSRRLTLSATQRDTVKLNDLTTSRGRTIRMRIAPSVCQLVRSRMS